MRSLIQCMSAVAYLDLKLERRSLFGIDASIAVYRNRLE